MRNKPGKAAPPDETGQEAAFLKHLCESHRDVTIKMVGGEEVSGSIEYYDRNMIRLTRNGAPNLFIFKHQIVYLKEAENPRWPPK
ncbi:MAG: RNA chaperone Hfq [Acidobacteriales bacterium]|nr:RNA chaperone Hfq [Terriglobales bacterium]